MSQSRFTAYWTSASLNPVTWRVTKYSIADVATYPWTMPRQRALHRIEIGDYPKVRKWADTISRRPAVQRGIAVLSGDAKVGNPTEETYKNMFGSAQFEQT